MRKQFVVNDGTKDNPKWMLVQLPEFFEAKRKLHPGRSSSVKKLGRIQRAHKRGYSKRPATQAEIRKHVTSS